MPGRFLQIFYTRGCSGWTSRTDPPCTSESCILACRGHVDFEGFNSCHLYCWWKKSGVHQLIWELSHYLWGSLHPRWFLWDFWTINSNVHTTDSCCIHPHVSTWKLAAMNLLVARFERTTFPQKAKAFFTQSFGPISKIISQRIRCYSPWN